MKCMAIDCEYNQPSKKTIEVGAVCFDPKDGGIFDTFVCYVNPFEELSQEIIDLTGIRDEQCQSGIGIKVAAAGLIAWKKRLEINPVGIVWGSGESNDIRHIYSEAEIESPFSDRVIDVKATYQMLANAQHSSMRKSGLGSSLLNVGLKWDDIYGNPHRALADALNTMRMYMFLSSCLNGGFNTIKSIRDL